MHHKELVCDAPIWSLQVEQALRDGEVDHQPGAIDQRCDQRRRDDGRVDLEAIDDEGQYGCDCGGPDADSQNGQGDDEAHVVSDMQ